jgi:hypothetical protein
MQTNRQNGYNLADLAEMARKMAALLISALLAAGHSNVEERVNAKLAVVVST